MFPFLITVHSIYHITFGHQNMVALLNFPSKPWAFQIKILGTKLEISEYWD